MAAAGPLPFDRFMDLALYSPAGYYQAAGALLGTDRVFYTSPAITPAFGALLARQLEEMWRRLDRPARFDLVECGAANGLLLGDILDFARRHLPDFAAAIHPVAVDVSTAPRRLAGRAAVVRSAGIPLLGLTGCILAHELWDNLAVRRWRRTAGVTSEIRIGWEDGRPVEVLVPAPGATPGEGDPGGDLEWETRPALDGWLADAAGALDRGYVLTIDYGYLDRQAWWAGHRRGSALAYRGQEVREDLLSDPGEWDVTAHVDLAAALDGARAAGFHGAQLGSQRDVLLALGIEPMVRGLARLGVGEEITGRNAAALRELVRPEGFGEFFVLALAKDAPLELRGFGPAVSGGEPDPAVPLAGRDRLDLTGAPLQNARSAWEAVTTDGCGLPGAG